MKSEVIKVAFVKHTGLDLWVIVECKYMKTVLLEIVSGVCIQCRETASYNTFSRAWLFLQHFDVRVYAFYYTRLIILPNFLISYKKTRTHTKVCISTKRVLWSLQHIAYIITNWRNENQIRVSKMPSLPSEFSPQKSKLGARYTPGLFDL